MKIIKHGKTTPWESKTLICSCGCHFALESSDKKDLRWIKDRESGKRFYLVRCPECHTEFEVDNIEKVPLSQD